MLRIVDPELVKHNCSFDHTLLLYSLQALCPVFYPVSSVHDASKIKLLRSKIFPYHREL